MTSYGEKEWEQPGKRKTTRVVSNNKNATPARGWIVYTRTHTHNISLLLVFAEIIVFFFFRKTQYSFADRVIDGLRVEIES